MSHISEQIEDHLGAILLNPERWSKGSKRIGVVLRYQSKAMFVADECHAFGVESEWYRENSLVSV